MSLGHLSVLLSAALGGAAGNPATPAPAIQPGSPATEEPKLHCLRRDELCVTHGEIGAGPSGRLAISDSVVRAVSTRGVSRTAELRFTLLGSTDKTVALSSGQVRRQLGLKLRAQNGCNLVYVMWRLEPQNELVVSVKRNPGMSTHAECGTQGYRNIPAAKSVPVPSVAPGEPHRLRAVLAEHGDGLEVLIDGVHVWSGALGTEALGFDGPVGVRTDNVRLEADLCQATEVSAAAPAHACTPTKEE
jgi:hypothetical protein